MLKAKIAIKYSWSRRVHAYESEGNTKMVTFTTTLPCKPSKGDFIKVGDELAAVAWVQIYDGELYPEEDWNIYVRMESRDFDGADACAEKLRDFYDDVEVKLRS